jgi:hypothetical protein
MQNRRHFLRAGISVAAAGLAGPRRSPALAGWAEERRHKLRLHKDGAFERIDAVLFIGLTNVGVGAKGAHRTLIANPSSSRSR